MNDKNTLCWNCKKVLSELPVQIGFRAVCPYCDHDLHVCKNCRYYAIGKPNDCQVPGTEPIRNRDAANFCEDFKVLTSLLHPPQHASDINILGKPEPKKDFNSLFKD